jgi:hypothetical protein
MQVLAALAQNNLADYHKISFPALFEPLCLGETPDRELLKRLYAHRLLLSFIAPAATRPTTLL